MRPAKPLNARLRSEAHSSCAGGSAPGASCLTLIEEDGPLKAALRDRPPGPLTFTPGITQLTRRAFRC